MANEDLLGMTPEQLRLAAANLIRMRYDLANSDRLLAARFAAIEAMLLNGPENVRLKARETVTTEHGVLVRHEEVKGRRYVVADEVMKDAGELGDLAPKPDERLVVEHLSDLPTAIQVELKQIAAREDSPVKITDKTKMPTVADLTKAFGKDTKYVGNPPKVTRLALAAGDGDDEVLIFSEPRP